jgi:signal transduction histidine kinase
VVAVVRDGTDDLSKQRLSYEQAIAACAHSLLTTNDSSALEIAARSLLSATDAKYLFIDRNVDDPEVGFAAANVVTVSKDQNDNDELDVWNRVPWSTMPAARKALSSGEVFMYAVEALQGSERAQHSDGLSDEVVKIPITIKDVWVGHMGIAAERGDGWTEDEVSLLRVATQMVGAYWERLANREQLESALETSDRQLRYQRALAICARELLMASDEVALERAVDAMREASGSWFGFLDSIEEDPDLGPVLVKVLTAVEPGVSIPPEDLEYWKRVPASRMPGAWASLQSGRAYLDNLGTSEGEDRRLYEESPVPPQTSLKLPIHVDGELVGVVGFAHGEERSGWTDDELELLQAGAQMIASHWQREASHSRLEELVASKDEFIAGVSHELRTPLTAVVGLAQELRSHGSVFSEEEVEEFVTLIAQQATDVAHIVEDLLVAARADIDRVTIVLQVVQISDELAPVLAGLTDLDAARVAVTGEMASVSADPARLRQIMRNLISNGLRYGGPRIEVALSQIDGHGVLEVRDDGAGIPEEQRGAIFDAYHRAHDSKSQPASVGLGLTVSRHLARLMNGELDYRVVEGWSVFRLTLPLADGNQANSPLRD